MLRSFRVFFQRKSDRPQSLPVKSLESLTLFEPVSFFGHCHGHLEPYKNSLDVGRDVNQRLLSIDEAIELARQSTFRGQKRILRSSVNDGHQCF